MGIASFADMPNLTPMMPYFPAETATFVVPRLGSGSEGSASAAPRSSVWVGLTAVRDWVCGCDGVRWVGVGCAVATCWGAAFTEPCGCCAGKFCEAPAGAGAGAPFGVLVPDTWGAGVDEEAAWPRVLATPAGEDCAAPEFAAGFTAAAGLAAGFGAGGAVCAGLFLPNIHLQFG